MLVSDSDYLRKVHNARVFEIAVSCFLIAALAKLNNNHLPSVSSLCELYWHGCVKRDQLLSNIKLYQCKRSWCLYKCFGIHTVPTVTDFSRNIYQFLCWYLELYFPAIIHKLKDTKPALQIHISNLATHMECLNQFPYILSTMVCCYLLLLFSASSVISNSFSLFCRGFENFLAA